ncbi:MAG: hypothetical protein ACRDTC_18505 [Pseudonocardiaceae bacterium]
MTTSEHGHEATRPLRLSRLFWLAVVVFLAAGTAYLLVKGTLDDPPRVTVFTPTRVLAPYEQILPDDVVQMEMQLSSKQPVVQDRMQVVGRYALTGLSPDHPIPLSAIGPLAPAALGTSYVFAIIGDPNLSLNGRQAPGDHDDLLLPGSGDGASGRLDNLFVLDSVVNDGIWIITLASSDVLAPEQSAALADSRVTVIRRPLRIPR